MEVQSCKRDSPPRYVAPRKSVQSRYHSSAGASRGTSGEGKADGVQVDLRGVASVHSRKGRGSLATKATSFCLWAILALLLTFAPTLPAQLPLLGPSVRYGDKVPPEVDQAYERGLQFLAQSQLSDGSWYAEPKGRRHHWSVHHGLSGTW